MDRIDALLQLLSQDDLPRTGWVLRGVAPAESLAGHVLGVAQVALALAPEVSPDLDLGRVLSMALVHDLPEALSGDLPRPAAEHLPAGAKADMERALAGELLPPLGRDASAAWTEYEAGATREARFVRICDHLQLGLRWLGYVRAGRGGLDEFQRGLAKLDAGEFPPCAALLEEILGGTRDGSAPASASTNG